MRFNFRFGKRNRFSISSSRKLFMLVTFSFSIYLLTIITSGLSDDYPWIFNPRIFSRRNGFIQNKKWIRFNNSTSLENSGGDIDQSKGPSSLKKNYFQHASRLGNLGRIVDTNNCKIPDFDVWDQDVLPFIKIAEPAENCKETHFNWSYVQNNKLVINRNQVELDGYFIYKGFCCYKVVERVTLNEDERTRPNKLKNADNLIKYSSCIDINAEETELQHEFIMVECGWIKFLPAAVAYRAFHSNAMVKGSQKSKNVEKKIIYWQSRNGEERLPPNILIVGLDSTSRLNFRRNMFKTQRILEELEAVEMMGYTKVGENTFPNFVPLTTGYSQEELEQICYFSRSTPQDDCPYIWKRFDAANYITAHSEDAPNYAIYNYVKTGFVQQPVDFYLRPIILSAHDYGDPPLYAIRSDGMNCIGQQMNDEAIISYVESVLDLGHKSSTPVYSVSWSTQGPHGDLNYIQLVDNLYATFLQRIFAKGYLDNTILIFMGDHGYRFGPIRGTLLGYYEDKLPAMWIRLPPWIKEEFPEWQTALEMNTRRLTSPFTMYWTLNLVLDMFSSMESPQNSVDAKTGQPIKRKHIQNFFEVVPESNTCSEIGVPEQYCACYMPQKILLDDPLLKESAITALNAKNKDIISSCAPLTVGLITAGTVMVMESGGVRRFVVAFTTIPGDFVLEAEIDYFTTNETFSNQPSVHRASAINPNHIKCLTDSKMEMYCYCV